MPMAEMPETSRRKPGFPWAFLFVALALGITLKAVGPTWVQTVFHSVKLDGFSGLSALLAAAVTAIVLHESGHALAAVFLDFEILAIALGPIRATRRHGKWSFSVSKQIFSGSVSAVPRNVESWRRRMLIIVAAGPVATLATGAIAALLLFYIQTESWPRTFLGGVTQLSIILFALGFVPNGKDARARNDARLFSIFWKDTQEAQQILLYHLVTRLELQGVRPRDYPGYLIRAMAATKGRPDSMLVYAHVIVLWALDRGDMTNADVWDQRAMQLSASCSVTAQQATLARSACLDVLIRNDYYAAREKFAKVHFDQLGPSWFMHRARAAYHLAEGNVPQVLEEICSARYAFPKQLPCYEFERSLLTQLHRKALAVAPKELIYACAKRAA